MKKIICCLAMMGLLAACTAKSTVFRAPDESKVQMQKELILPPEWDVRPAADAVAETSADTHTND